MTGPKPKPRTRRDLLYLLKTQGPSDAAGLAARLDVTAMAVRQHLYELRAEGLVGCAEEARPVGRPAKLWHLTEAADRHFPDAHAELAVGLIESVRDALGVEAMDRLIADRSAKQAAAYRAALDRAGPDLRCRAEALATLRTAEGYMAAVEDIPAEEGDGVLLVENHCPICSAAKACSGLCAMELEVFREALGPAVQVERTDHILAGARRCAYRLRPLSSERG
jgi:predicted ArsR family transcriptional regulator